LTQPERGGCRKRADRRKTSVVLGQVELVGGDYRNRGRGEGGLLELSVKIITDSNGKGWCAASFMNYMAQDIR
jgi:hypothetical protein